MSDSVNILEQDVAADTGAGGSLWSDAWVSLRRNPIFWFSVVIVAMVVSWAAFPGLWTTVDPNKCVLTENQAPPSDKHIFGTTVLGCDMYTHVIYGARPSIIIAVIVTLATAVIGSTLGTLVGVLRRLGRHGDLDGSPTSSWACPSCSAPWCSWRSCRSRASGRWPSC